MSIQRNKLNIGLFGFGVVGEALYSVLAEKGNFNAAISRVVIKHPEKERSAPSFLFSTNPADILEDDSINVVVELIDDADAAFNIIKTALLKGKAVVSANKKAIAEHLSELLEIQKISGAPFLYEAAACASIPVIRNLEEYYDNDLLQGIQGIVNGSTNYILTKVAEEGLSYEEALFEAQVAGFAESDPSLDVNGIDAVNKLSILLAHAYGIIEGPQNIVHSGIQSLHELDAKVANEKRYAVKLVAQARKLSDGSIASFVLPQFVKREHLLHTVRNEYNGVVIESGLAEQQFFYGKGAGGIATASAVLSDLSALRYDYKYEYKKRYHQQAAKLSNDFYLRVYVSFDSLFQVPHELFTRIEEWTSTEKRCSVTGVLHFSKLSQAEWWKRPGTSIILYPDAILEKAAVKELKKQAEPEFA